MTTPIPNTTVLLPPPDRELVLLPFIVANNAMENETCTLADVQDTLARRAVHPLAAGHFSAIQLGLSLSSSPAWPLTSDAQFRTVPESSKSLHWLQNLHTKLGSPLATFNAERNIQGLTNRDLGVYRLTPRFIGGNRHLPDPFHIPKLMRQWLADLGAFHLRALPHLGKPSSTLYLEADRQARRSHLLLQCIHPWTDLTGRTSRLVENLLRSRWGLPWRKLDPERVEDYIKEIMTFEDGKEWSDFKVKAKE